VNKDSKEMRLYNTLLKKDEKFHGKNIDPFIYPSARLGANQEYIQFTSIGNLTRV
jgi:hypothetical protein